ncbi:MAG: thioredoxin domain-containing protein [Bdellovibrionota bacterium]
MKREFFIFFVLALLGGCSFFANKPPIPPLPNLERIAPEKLTLDDLPSRGLKGSKVLVVQISDFQCPFCAKSHEAMEREIFPKYKDRVEFRFKQFPIGHHEWASRAAAVSLCAGEQGKFWEAADFFFSHQIEIEARTFGDFLDRLTREAKLEKAVLAACLEKGEADQKARRDFDESLAAGIQGVPTVLVNGWKLEGLLETGDIEKAIEAELSR